MVCLLHKYFRLSSGCFVSSEVRNWCLLGESVTWARPPGAELATSWLEDSQSVRGTPCDYTAQVLCVMLTRSRFPRWSFPERKGSASVVSLSPTSQCGWDGGGGGGQHTGSSQDSCASPSQNVSSRQLTPVTFSFLLKYKLEISLSFIITEVCSVLP